jgi:Helix-turn-helix domain
MRTISPDTILLHMLRNRSAAENDRCRQARGGLSSRALRIVREKIEDSLELGVTLADLAREVGFANVAFEVGFSSQAHFTDQFRRVTGSTPLRFRRRR